MLKRIISGVLAFVLLTASIPISAFAESTSKLSASEVYKITTTWMTNLYNAARKESSWIELKDISVKVVSTDNDMRLTLVPLFDNNLKPTFNHVQYLREISPEYTYISTSNQNKATFPQAVSSFRQSIVNSKQIYNTCADGPNAGSFDTPTNKDSNNGGHGNYEPYVYGSIGAMDSNGLLYPLYYYWEINGNNIGSDSSQYSFLYCINAVGANGVSDLQRYSIDPLSYLLFVAKIHTLFHDQSIWEKLGMGDEYTSMKTSGYFDTDACKNEDCPILDCLTVGTSKGTVNTTNGTFDVMLYASDIFSGTSYSPQTDSYGSITLTGEKISPNAYRLRQALNASIRHFYNWTGANPSKIGNEFSRYLPTAANGKLTEMVVKDMTAIEGKTLPINSLFSVLISGTLSSNAESQYDGNNPLLNNKIDGSTLFTDGSDSSILKDDNNLTQTYSNYYTVLYAARFLVENGFMSNSITVDANTSSMFSGDCAYLEAMCMEISALLSGSHIDANSRKFLNTYKAVYDLAKSAGSEYLDAKKSSIDAAQEDADKNRCADASGVDTSYGTMAKSMLFGLPTKFRGLSSSSENYVDTAKLFKTMNYTRRVGYNGYGVLTITEDSAYDLDAIARSISDNMIAAGSYSAFKDTIISKSDFAEIYKYMSTEMPGVLGSNFKLKDRDAFVNEIVNSVIYYVYNKCKSDTKYDVLHNIWIAVYEGEYTGNNYFGDGKVPSWYSTMESDLYKGEKTVASEAQLVSLRNQYDYIKSSTGDSELSGGRTLKIRSQVFDFFAKYSLSYESNDVIALAYGETVANLSDANARVGAQTLPYEPCNYLYAGKYYLYQMMLEFEASIDADLIYYDLMVAVAKNGVTLENNSKQIEILSNIKYIVDTYRGTNSMDFWTKVRDTGDTILTPEQDSIRTLAGLYNYLVRLGFISANDYTVDIYDESNPLTTFWTQTNGNITFSSDYYTGRSLSATYIPMQTNVYDPYAMLDYVETNWIENFHYKYGFHRKALLIDTNVDAAVDSHVSNTVGTTRVATLQDLFNCESDIVLYEDTRFYGLSELAELQNKTYDRLASSNPTIFDKISSSISDMFSMFREVDFDVALKQTTDTYSVEIGNNVSDMSFEMNEDGSNLKKYDQYILTPSAITEYIGKSEYTPMMGYAMVSNIYRDKESFNTIAQVIATRTPVFESSPTLATVSNDKSAQNTIYNYALLKNIKAMTTVGYETSTDMTSPIYSDIYGNIVTESGLVVIPAACNATLHGDNFQPICTGFLSTYGKEWSIPTSWNISEDFMQGMFYKNDKTGTWDIRNKTVQGMEINFAQLSYSDKTVNVALKEMYNYNIVNSKGDNAINQYNSLNVLHETLRGAPLENIDFDAENLNSVRKVDRSGLIAAAKLDSIVNSINWDDDNSIMSLPRLSFIDNYQYIVVFVFKILLVIIVTALMITVYVDVLKTRLSWRTIGKCVFTLVLGVSTVLLIPVSYDISYYQSNKLLLQDEAKYIMMLNTEKNMSGREIGVYEVTEPEQHTQIFIKLEDYEFNWLSELPNVIFGDSINVMNEKYEEFLNSSLLANADNVQAMNDGMYMDVQDIFDTSVLNFSTTSKQLYQKVSVDPVASYYIPYYYFLDALITNMNDYNSTNNVYAYSTKIMRGGAVKTVNLCDAYFNSPDFLEANDADYLGLYQLYNTMGSMVILPIFNEEAITGARQSQWFVGTMMDEDDILARLEVMDEKTKQFVAENRNLIGKVTDETFLKCMAMDLAIEYNNIFGIPSANAFEVYNLSNADLMRLTVADKACTLEDSPMSFSRFVYNEAGTPGVYAAVFLVITTLFVQTMKTIITIAIMVLLIVSLFIFKILLRKANHSIGGYFLTLLVICSTNILYAIILKVSLAIPQTGLAPTLCIIIQVLIQLAYLAILVFTLIFALRDWKNIGFTQYQNIGYKIKEKFSHFRKGDRRSPEQRYDDQPRGVNGWDYYRKLVKENERRMKKGGAR